tara:strand:+ start:1197 stop:1418 length:222 start_codon:yes stop_codon:yes gene_type:complete
MAEFTIKPATLTSRNVLFTPSVDIRVDSIENTHALELNFSNNDVISANTLVNISEIYASKDFIPEVVVTYTEI